MPTIDMDTLVKIMADMTMHNMQTFNIFTCFNLLIGMATSPINSLSK
jgi:hypothetical protein